MAEAQVPERTAQDQGARQGPETGSGQGLVSGS